MRRSCWIRCCIVVTAIVSGTCLQAAQAPEKTALDKTERALVAFSAGAQPQAVDLLEQAVNINSGTMNFAGVRAVGKLFEARLTALGFKTRWEAGEPFGRAGHLIAERPGSGKHVLLIGHLDTVFEPDSPFQHFERAGPERVNGPGVADMKGGVVVALTALAALEKAKVLDRLRLTLVLHGDEEDAGEPLETARASLIAAAKAADIAIGLENAADDPTSMVTARRSSSQWRLEVQGNTAHSSRIFSSEVGAGPVYEMARILNGFYEQLHQEQYLTFNVGLTASGAQLEFVPGPLQAKVSGKDNIVPPRAVASGDLRAISKAQIAQAKQAMLAISTRNLPGTSVKLEFQDSYPPMAPTEGNRRLLEMYSAVSRDLGFGPVTEVDPRRAGAADISFAADHVEMGLDGLGLLGGGAHTPGEFADLRTFQIQTQRLAVLLYRLSRIK
jgi:glutamate carboxypeptidase